jgi:maleate isomerase
MTDTLGWRLKIGVLVPSTNTSVQPEYDAMRPRGVTNHVRAFRIPNAPTRTNAEFRQQQENMRATMVDAMDDALTLEPGHVILATAPESGGGLAGAPMLREQLLAKSGGKVTVTIAADALQAALNRVGGVHRIGLVTPYMPLGDEQARAFFLDCGIQVVRLKGLKCAGPVLIAHTSEQVLRDAIVEVNGDDVEAVVIVGTNLPMARVAATTEAWISKPVIALNTASYWHALRTNGIQDNIYGFGRLLSEF